MIAFLLRDKYFITAFQAFVPVEISDLFASGAENFEMYCKHQKSK